MSKFIATAIRMKDNCYYSNNLLEIDKIYLEHSKDGWYSKGTIHDYVKDNPNSVVVANSNGPSVIPAISQNGEKYVKSSPNSTEKDNLLSLPKK